jgi:hypothetical protein
VKPHEFYPLILKDVTDVKVKTLYQVLEPHLGLSNALQKPDLISECYKHGLEFKAERTPRLIITNSLRKIGVLACSSSREGGYFLAATLAEYREFRGREYIKKIIDMRETIEIMDRTAKILFPVEYAAYQREKVTQAGQPTMI